MWDQSKFIFSLSQFSVVFKDRDLIYVPDVAPNQPVSKQTLLICI